MENDPVNIAHALGGDYLSYLSVTRMSPAHLKARLAGYDLVLAALATDALGTVQRICNAAGKRFATYSEGHIGDYQTLSPAKQWAYIKLTRAAQVNFLYWEKYVNFFEVISSRPAVYMPYPYLVTEAGQHATSWDSRPLLATSPTGLAGHTRNGMASLAVVGALLERGIIEQAECWPDAQIADEDVKASAQMLNPEMAPPHVRPPLLNWRMWLAHTGLDYRPLLALQARLMRHRRGAPDPIVAVHGQVTYLRRTGWQPYMKRLARSRLLIDMNNRETVGRNALDCAALGVPCISTNRSDLQAKLFPLTTLDNSWDISGAVRLGERIMSEPEFRAQVTEYAASRLQDFAPPMFQERFNSAATQWGLRPT